LKAGGKIAFPPLYLPEKLEKLRYTSAGAFRRTVDGHPMEATYSGAIHDMYHAFRELDMSEWH
jgi:hypothetical protein